MEHRKASRKQRLTEYLAEAKPAAITGLEWEQLLRELAPISESYLRELLHANGLPFEQPYAGVTQKTFEDLERSLIDLEKVYAEATRLGDRIRARYCRRQVIGAKDRARFISRNPKISAEKRAEKEEMVQWMLVWLENPGVFPEWVKLRKKVGGKGADASPPTSPSNVY